MVCLARLVSFLVFKKYIFTMGYGCTTAEFMVFIHGLFTGDIGKNLESTKRFRDEMSYKVESLQKTVEGISLVCDSNHSSLGSNLEKIASIIYYIIL